MRDNRTIIFVYNADSGVISIVKDFWKKIVRPSSYECNLCMQTFGMFSMKKDWRNFINQLNFNVEFLHRDEFEKKYEMKDEDFPSAYLLDNNELHLLISAEEMNSVNSLDEMEVLVLNKVNNVPLISQSAKIE